MGQPSFIDSKKHQILKPIFRRPRIFTGKSARFTHAAFTSGTHLNRIHFANNINEHLIRETADAIATNGMKDAGYVYLNIDDCWQGQRDAQGFIQPDPQRFPSGMKALADYIHSKGLKFGHC